MKRSLLAGLAGAAALAVAAVNAKPLSIELPADTTTFRPGPNLETVQGNCGACHSTDYVLTQPRGEKFKKAFWEAEVAKMINVYGAPIEAQEATAIVDYLAKNYGAGG